MKDTIKQALAYRVDYNNRGMLCTTRNNQDAMMSERLQVVTTSNHYTIKNYVTGETVATAERRWSDRKDRQSLCYKELQPVIKMEARA